MGKDSVKFRLPKVSIITVSYNAEKTIEKTILSVINQTYENIEYIIIDGKSSDKTLEIIKKYEKKISYWVSETDGGIYDAMNKGITKSTGDIIGIINSDDWYEEKTVEIAVENIFFHNVNGVCGNIIYHDINGNIIKLEKFKSKPEACEMKKRMTIAHPSIFVKKDFYDLYGFFDVKYKISADYDLFLRAILKNCKLQYCENLNVNFRLGGASAKNSLLSLIEVANIRRENKLELFFRIERILYDFCILIICVVRKIVLNKICGIKI